MLRLERRLGALVAILVLAAIVRLWGLGGQPVLFFDSGVYLGEGAFLASAAQRAASALVSPGPVGPLERVALATQDGTDAHPPDIAKPGHAVLLAISMLLLGKTALAGALVSALAGIGTIAATYALGMRGWGPRVAIPAAILLAISGQAVVYSREPLVEADGMFFATVAALIYLRSSSLRGLLAGGRAVGRRLHLQQPALVLARRVRHRRTGPLARPRRLHPSRRSRGRRVSGAPGSDRGRVPRGSWDWACRRRAD